jgi:hypothetical protein
MQIVQKRRIREKRKKRERKVTQKTKKQNKNRLTIKKIGIYGIKKNK